MIDNKLNTIFGGYMKTRNYRIQTNVVNKWYIIKKWKVTTLNLKY